ncbi:MAG: hypothetical protein [Microviridae sp.]|nr:MAG: hypothetical protein [Microviridae sp.]
MKNVKLYPNVPRVKQDVKSWKKTVVPNQSMTLREILKRFVRKESLPVSTEGSYHEGDYDLEKLAKSDITEQYEVIEELKKKVKRKKKEVDDYQLEQKKKQDEDRAKGQQDPNPPKTEPPKV